MIQLCRLTRWGFLLVFVLTARYASAQIVITEIMHSPGGNDSLWEWIEILNTSSQPVDLHGWVFDDDDDANLSVANISNASGTRNTIVPAGGVAVLYPGNQFGYNPQRLADAWGNGITFIGLDNFTALTPTDSIGLWSNFTNYSNDTISDATTSPRRNFTNAVAAINYSTGFPQAAAGRSIAWNGTGPITSGANWVASQSGTLNAFTSMETRIDGAPINSTSDRGNPGVLPTGSASPGLLITEIMFAPQSPAATVGYSEADFEWVEIFNNTATDINFEQQAHVFDDAAGNNITAANLVTGSVAAGGIGILYNSTRITLEQMQTMWGSQHNYIPVSNWPALNNTGGDTIAIWESYNDYNSEPGVDSNRTHQNAIAAVTYNTVAAQGWPTVNNQSSIYLHDLDGDVNAGISWRRAGASGDTISRVASPIFAEVVDHPGGDVGSPGFAPGVVQASLNGDYNNDGSVNAADYVLWRKFNGTSITLPNDPTPGSVTPADYTVWRTNFGQSNSGAGSGISNVPEPSSMVWLACLFASLLWPSRFAR